jgi:hypothetical protein
MRIPTEPLYGKTPLSAKQLAVAEAGIDHVDSPEMVMVHGPDDAPEVLVSRPS